MPTIELHEGLCDADLLNRFAAVRDETAFAELVRRHGRLVWGVCRRRLDSREDAEDAFQATFLILAVKAGTIRQPAALAGWLHRTATRTSLRIASSSSREIADEAASGGLDAFSELARRESIAAVDEELVRLPHRYRDAIVLFHLDGLDRRQVAERLGVSDVAVKSLLARGRSLLRSRLARRGVALPLLLPLAIEPVPAEAASSATRTAVSMARSGLSPFDLLSVTVKGLPPMLTWFTNKTAAAVLIGAACLSLFLVVRSVNA
ncbi:MAG: sigma-70 family RNA polymerase sigma factor, partial [Planctomycetaceae bacterium]